MKEQSDNHDLTFYDQSRAEALHTDADIKIEGERFVCDMSQISAEKIDMLSAEKTTPVIAILHPRGIVLLQDGTEIKNKAILESYSFKTIESFGATGADCFGFKFREFYICLYSEESAHLMNTLCMRKLKVWRILLFMFFFCRFFSHIPYCLRVQTWEGGVEPGELPIVYRPSQ